MNNQQNFQQNANPANSFGQQFHNQYSSHLQQQLNQQLAQNINKIQSNPQQFGFQTQPVKLPENTNQHSGNMQNVQQQQTNIKKVPVNQDMFKLIYEQQLQIIENAVQTLKQLAPYLQINEQGTINQANQIQIPNLGEQLRNQQHFFSQQIQGAKPQNLNFNQNAGQGFGITQQNQNSQNSFQQPEGIMQQQFPNSFGNFQNYENKQVPTNFFEQTVPNNKQTMAFQEFEIAITKVQVTVGEIKKLSCVTIAKGLSYYEACERIYYDFIENCEYELDNQFYEIEEVDFQLKLLKDGNYINVDNLEKLIQFDDIQKYKEMKEEKEYFQLKLITK